MDTKFLRSFITIVDSNGFTRAGRRLGLSQSAVSQQISSLERQLGVTLLLRTPRGIAPTPAGETLLHYARLIIAKSDEAQRMLAAFDAAEGSGILRIGAGSGACEYLLPSLLARLYESFPQYQPRVMTGPSRRIVHSLVQGELDVGLVSLPITEPKLKVFELARDEIVVVGPPEHAWADRKMVHVQELGNQPIIVYDRHSETFHTFEKALLEAGVFPRIVMELDHLGAAVRLVRNGLGIAAVPRWAVRESMERQEVFAASIGNAGLYRPWGIGVRAEDQQMPAVRTFVRLALETLPPLLTP